MLAVSLQSVWGQTIYHARISGQVLFNNSNPEVRTILGDPGREGMTQVRVHGTASGASATADSSQPSSSFFSKDYELDVQTTVLGLNYRVASAVGLDGGREFYQTRQTDVGLVLPFTTTPLDIVECAGLLEIRFVTDLASHAPVTIDGGRIEAQISGQPVQYPAPFGASQLPSTNRLYLALRGGETCRIGITYRRGQDPFSNTVFRRHDATVTVPCDTIQLLEVVVPPEASLGRLAGMVDMQREFELPGRWGFEIRPDPANFASDYVVTNLTGLSAVGGPFANYRYTSRGGQPASGPYSLPNLLPSGETSPEQPYTVSATMEFDHAFTHGSPPSAAMTREIFVTPRQKVSVRAGENDLGNAFVINPGYLFGAIHARGPAEIPGRPSPLRAFSAAHVSASGMDEIAPGASFSAVGGLASGSAPGGFDAAADRLVNHYELAMGGLKGEASIWSPTSVAFGFYTNPPASSGYIQTSVLVNDRRPRSFPVSPGSRHTNDLNYCFSQVILNLRTSAGRLFDPRIVSGGGGVATNGEYSVYIAQSTGTPLSAGTASNRAQVVTLLPAGIYNFLTQVQFRADDGDTSTIYPGAISRLEVGCGEIVTMTPPCLSMALDSSRCFPTPSGMIHGRVSTCTNNPVAIYYTLNGQTNFWGSITGPNASFSIPLSLLGPCTENTLTVLAVDEYLSNASITTTLRYDNTAPVITPCPSNIVAECQSPLGTTVHYPVVATDECDPVPRILCQPASGSLFPPGTTRVTCAAEDSCGNARTCEFPVTIRDTTPPVIFCPTNILVECSGINGTVVAFPVTTSDNCETNIPVTCYPPSGTHFPVGETMVRCWATDGSENFSECSFVVRVTPSRLTIERSVTVRWSCGILQGADDISGPWTDIPGAAHPYCVPSDQARRFYRTRN